MLSLQTVFHTLKSDCHAQYLRTEDLSEAGYLYFRFQLWEQLDLIVRFNLGTNMVEAFETVDDYDWDNDLVKWSIETKKDLLLFVVEAMKKQVASRKR